MKFAPLYAALLVPLYYILSFRVISARRGARVEIGDGQNPELLRRIRVHANFVETVPFALILMAFAETGTMPRAMLHGIGVLLLVGRYAHAYALSQTPHVMRLRIVGMVLTFFAIGMGAAGSVQAFLSSH